MKLMLSSKKLRGLTLIETLLALGVAAVVIVGAVVLYNNAAQNSKLNDARTQVQSIIGGINTLFGARSTYVGLNTAMVVNSGLAPASTIAGATMVNPWRGDYTITPVAPTNRSFTIVMSQVPREACTSLLSGGLINTGNIFSMAANATTFTTDPAPAAALAACNNATANTITFTAR